jgi:uncharacterized protein
MNDLVTQLLYAAGRGDVVSVRKILEDGLSVNTANNVGGTALMSACACYCVEMVEFLLHIGANVNLRTNDGRTALHAAVSSTASFPEKQRACVRLLIEHAALTDAQDKSGITPLMNAVWFGCLPSVLELLNAGAKIGLKDIQGRTAKDLAIIKQRNEIVKVLSKAER